MAGWRFPRAGLIAAALMAGIGSADLGSAGIGSAWAQEAGRVARPYDPDHDEASPVTMTWWDVLPRSRFHPPWRRTGTMCGACGRTMPGP